MRDKSLLSKSYLLDSDRMKIIFPDGEISSDNRRLIFLGERWKSKYWGKEVEVVEMNEDEAWVEEVIRK